MCALQQERRAQRRLPLALSISVVHSTSREEWVGTTRDINAGGVFFLVDARFGQPRDITFRVTVPKDLVFLDATTIQCRGRVLRVEELKDKIGVAATIDSFSLKPEPTQ